MSQMSHVYLVKHIASGQPYIIKRLSKAHALYGQMRREADILCSMDFTFAPKVFRVFEDSDYSYIVMEYFHGDDLCGIVRKYGSTPLSAVLFGLSICSILKQLHDHYPIPIFYLDFSPKHFILCGSTLKVIDFGASMLRNGPVKRPPVLTPGFCAPELNQQRAPDERADIYGACAMVRYLLGACGPTPMDNGDSPLSDRLGAILDKALQTNKRRRFRRTDDLYQSLKSLLPGTVSSGKIKRIAVISLKNGYGATHVSIALTSAMNLLGQPACYIPKDPEFLDELSLLYPSMTNSSGNYCYMHFRGSRAPSDDGVMVMDIGRINDAATDLPKETDLILIVARGAPWEYGSAVSLTGMPEPKRRLFVLNGTDRQRAGEFSKRLFERCLIFPNEKDPFIISWETCAIARAVLDLL